MRRIVKGPQIHFWVSEKTAPEKEPNARCCTDCEDAIHDEERGAEMRKKKNIHPRSTHAEIF